MYKYTKHVNKKGIASNTGMIKRVKKSVNKRVSRDCIKFESMRQRDISRIVDLASTTRGGCYSVTQGRGYPPKQLKKQKGVDMNRNEAHKNIGNKRRECVNCGTTENLEIHHIVPLSRGGNDIESNLVYLCSECHCKAHGIKVRNKGEGRPRKDAPYNYREVLTRYITGKIDSNRVKDELRLANGSRIAELWYYKQFLEEMGIKEVERKCGRGDRRTRILFCNGEEEFYRNGVYTHG